MGVIWWEKLGDFGASEASPQGDRDGGVAVVT